MDEQTRKQEGQMLSRSCNWLRASVFVGLGALLMILFLLPGCGSDSKPGGAVSAKNQKAAKPGDKGSQAAISSVIDHGGSAAGTVNQEPPSTMNVEVLPGVTRGELEAKAAADRKKSVSSNKEIFPGAGITQAQLEAKAAADRAKRELSKNSEIFPGAGVTPAQLEAKAAADRAKRNLSPNVEIFPGAGITQAELQAKAEADREKSYDPSRGLPSGEQAMQKINPERGKPVSSSPAK